ncbi:MAG: MFS transporter, partial [Salinisphaera sp.]|nr:MFS transporter [Salinisphaera sp.]
MNGQGAGAMVCAERRERPAHILPVIVLAQFACVSLWFAGNAILPSLQMAWGLTETAVGPITSAVQIGFVVGTLSFAFFALSDRFPPAVVFLVCALLGALCNLAVLACPPQLAPLLGLRFATGFFLAGIYPVGMKIAASWYAQGLGRAMGYLLGALVLGTALPHLLAGLGADLDWQWVVVATSALAVAGGLAVFLLVPVGPHLPAKTRFDLRAIPRIFKEPDLRAAAFGYFGHMWELYALWAFLPLVFAAYAAQAGLEGLNISLAAFAVIASGAIGCAAGGLVAQRVGSARVAAFQLACSGLACLLSPLLWYAPPALYFAFFVFWGITVAGDSPQFSTLSANTAPREYVGTALTLINGIGFTITAIAIQVLTLLVLLVPPQFLFVVLLPGPVLGLIASR